MKLPNKFPSISRIITENKVLLKISKFHLSTKKNTQLKKFYSYFSIILSLLAIVVLSGLIIFVSYNFAQNYIKYTNLSNQREALTGKIHFWSSIANEYSGFPDAYFNIAIYYYELNDLNSAKKFNDQALLLNPDYQKAKILKNKLSSKGY